MSTLGSDCPVWSSRATACVIDTARASHGVGVCSAPPRVLTSARRPVTEQLLVGLALLLTNLFFASTAVSHGADVAQVLSVVATDFTGAPSVLRLNEGLALRQREEWRYLCPTLWGQDQVVPAVSVTGGPVFVASSHGLLLLDAATGELTPHPEAEAAQGRTLSLRSTGDSVLQLRVVDEVTQVLLVDASTVSVIFEDTTAWEAFDANEQVIALVRVLDPGVEQQLLSSAGTELGRESATAPPDALAVSPRVVGSQAYVVAVTSDGYNSELGRLETGEWLPEETVTGAIAGPIERAAGGLWLSLAGELGVSQAARVTPTGDTKLVTCLGRQGALTYACAEGALWRLEDNGLGEELFNLSELRGPVLDGIPAEQASECDLQWQRYQVDLRAIGIEPRVAVDAGGSVAEAGTTPTPRPHDSSCSWTGARTTRGALGRSELLLGATFLVLAAIRRRSR